VQAVVRGQFTEAGLDTLIPTCITGGQPPSGCPSDQARLLRSEIVLPPYTRNGRAYFTTPPACPPSGRWRSTITLTYGDGVSSTVHPEQPCAPTRDATQPATPPPAVTRCRSRRRVTFRALARAGMRRISAVVRGRRIRLDPRRPVLDLGGLPRGRYTVRVSGSTRSGRRVAFTRRYRTCGG